MHILRIFTNVATFSIQYNKFYRSYLADLQTTFFHFKILLKLHYAEAKYATAQLAGRVLYHGFMCRKQNNNTFRCLVLFLANPGAPRWYIYLF